MDTTKTIIGVLIVTMALLGFYTGLALLKHRQEQGSFDVTTTETKKSVEEQLRQVCPNGIDHIVFDNGYATGLDRPMKEVGCK